MDFLKKTLSRVTDPFGASKLGAAIGSALTGGNKAPAPQTAAPQAPVTTPAPVMGSVQGPSQPSAPIAPNPASPAYSAAQVNMAAQNEKFSNTLPVVPTTTINAKALSPDNTMSGLLNTRRQLEERYLKTFEPNDNLTNLAKIKNEIADVTEEYDRRIEVLEKNPNGVFGQGVLGTQLTKLRGEKNKELGYLALRESNAQGLIDATKEEQANLLKGIEQINKLTNKETVGSPYTDEVTGVTYGYFRDPSTGQVSQEEIGKVTPKRDLLWDVDSAGNVTIVDKNDPFNEDGSPKVVRSVVQAGTQESADFSYAVDQLVATGKLPTNLPPGVSPGAAYEAAKSKPKRDGALVSNTTGVTPTTEIIPVERKNAIVALYDIYKKVDQLAELDKKRGVDGAFVLNTADATKYLGLRTEITDLLTRARTGAALTEAEEKFYSKMLPGRAKEEFLGKNSEDMIQTFKDNIRGSLDTNLNLFQSSIYGYSKVDVNGDKRTVGEQVTAPNGLTGFIGPDGNIYLPPSEAPQKTSFNSPGSGNVPQRNNNPGNIKAGGIADNYATGTDEQGHLIFPDAETGFRAFAEDVQAKVSGNSRHLPPNPTLQQLGSVYAEDPNWPFAVARILGVPVGTPTQQIPFDQLVQAIATQEGFYA